MRFRPVTCGECDNPIRPCDVELDGASVSLSYRPVASRSLQSDDPCHSIQKGGRRSCSEHACVVRTSCSVFQHMYQTTHICIVPYSSLNRNTHTYTHTHRVRENLLSTLTRKFIDEMKLYQSAQQKYKTDIQKKMKRQVKVVKPDATDEEVENIMKSEGGRDQLYKQTILAGGINDEIK